MKRAKILSFFKDLARFVVIFALSMFISHSLRYNHSPEQFYLISFIFAFLIYASYYLGKESVLGGKERD
jgi:hypothetical protein